MRKNILKSLFVIMSVSLLPFSNLAALTEINFTQSVSDNLKKVSVEKAKALTKDSLTTSKSLFQGKSITQPNRTPLETQNVEDAINNFGAGNIGGILNSNEASQLVVLENGSVWSDFTPTTVSDSSVKAALYAMYSNGNPSSDYTLYFGAATSLTAATTGIAVATPSATNMSFANLTNKIKSLTLVSDSADPTTSTNSQNASAKTITFATAAYFGCPTVFRNFTYTGNISIYAQGNPMIFGKGSWSPTVKSIYGGSLNSDVIGDTNLFFYSTGAGAGWNIYGGNASGGTISGNTHVTIANTGTGTITQLSSGNASGGIVSGNTNLDVQNTGDLTITNIYSAGVGTSTAPVLVKGDVINLIESQNDSTRYTNVYGGANYGTISGTIYNIFGGRGGWTGTNTPSSFVGGNLTGNVGTQGITQNAIQTSYDTSAFTSGVAQFSGGNNTVGSSRPSGNTYSSGTISGNITNYVKSSFTRRSGSLYGVAGGNGPGASDLTVASGLPATNPQGPANETIANNGPENYDDQLLSSAKTGSNNISAVLGDIYTWEQGGLVTDSASSASAAYTGLSLAGSYGGYDRGKTVLEVGTPNSDGSVGGDGVVTGYATSTASANTTSWLYTNDGSVQRGYNSGFEFAAGGHYGPVGSGDGYFHTGDSYSIVQNTVARWTYGGNHSGYQWGNSNYIMNAAILAQAIGSGYGNAVQWGDSSVEINNGQVERNIAGFGWGCRYLKGDASVIVNNGHINGVVLGNMGNQVYYTMLNGNSTVNIYGGDFSGKQDTTIIGNTKFFSPGIFNGRAVSGNNGTRIYGNTEMNIDLTGPNGNSFVMPTGTYISGGTPYGSSIGNIGSSSSNSISLNIKTTPGTKKFEGATIYGDASSANTWSAAGNNIGKIDLNINADGSSFNNIYTSATNIGVSSGLAVNSSIFLSGGINLTGTLSGGNLTDNFTNAIVGAGSNRSQLTLGDNTDNTDNTILISGKLTNFTDLSIADKANINVVGNILNGSGATSANHGTNYSNFGTLQLGDSATIQTGSASGQVSIGKLISGKNSFIATPYLQSSGIINISDLDLDKGNLIWVPLGTAPTSITNTYSGAYWGSQKGFPVLTFSGGNSATGLQQIRPDKFYGIDKTTNYSFLGDYDSSKSVAYVIPGQMREYNTIGNDNSGNWEYDLFDVSYGIPTPGSNMAAWASVAPNTKASNFTLMYTMSYQHLQGDEPFSFNTNDPYYIQSRSALGFDGRILNSYPDFPIPDLGSGGAVRNFTTSDYFTGNNKDGSNETPTLYGSYISNNVETDNNPTVMADNIIISETKALTLSFTELKNLMNVSGTGVIGDLAISNDAIKEANEGLDGKQYKKITVEWSNGTATNKSILVVVPDNAEISSDGQTALDAYDTNITSNQANAITSQNDLDFNYTQALAFNADGTTHEATLVDASILISQLQSVNTTTSFIANYEYGSLSKSVAINVTAGKLMFSSAPSSVEFGVLNVSPNDIVAYPTYDQGVTVTDTRPTGTGGWSLTVSEMSPLSSGTNTLSGSLLFNDGTTSTVLSTSALVVASDLTGTNGVFNISQNWNSSTKEGIYLNVPVDEQRAGDYKGTLVWSLNDTP